MLQDLEALITEEAIARLEGQESLSFTANSQHSIADRRGLLKTLKSVDVQACPGSGKTTLVAAKLILLAHKWPARQKGVCVLSHTNVAKNEITSRLEASKTIEARKLLSYPHFIGTIQEFINKFLAIPSLRSQGIDVAMIDTDACVERIRRKLSYTARSYIDSKSQHKDVLYDFGLKIEGSKIGMNIPTFSSPSDSTSYRELKSARENLIKEGCLFYHDLYVFAQLALKKNPLLASVLQKRFPVVLLDEMQDTQKFQDEILQSIFPLNNPDIAVQRFGDPDQAIFNGINDEEPNESYNGRQNMDFVINLSHRFDGSIVKKIDHLSFNAVPLASELNDAAVARRRSLNSSGSDFNHTIFVYADSAIKEVIPQFAELVNAQFSEAHKQSEKFTVKVVGAVGNEIDPTKAQLKIGHYWTGYDKSKSKTAFRPTSLIEAVYYSRRLPREDLADAYHYCNSYIVGMLRAESQTDAVGNLFNATVWKAHLKDRNFWVEYRRFLSWALDSRVTIDEPGWNPVAEMFKKFLSVAALGATLEQALTYSPENLASPAAIEEPQTLTQIDNNILRHSGGFHIHLSTIHGVKGETHDATLVLETRNYCCDIQAMLAHLTGALPNTRQPNSGLKPSPSNARDPSKMANQKFLRQLYVGMSRSKHLLCIAINSSRISNADLTSLQALGWNVAQIGSA